MSLDESTSNSVPPAESVEKTKAAFLKDCVLIPLSNLIYLKTLRPRVKDSITFQQILSSVRDGWLRTLKTMTSSPNVNRC